MSSTRLAHVYEICPRKDHRGVDLISDALPFGRLWYAEPDAASNAIGYAEHRSRSHDAGAAPSSTGSLNLHCVFALCIRALRNIQSGTAAPRMVPTLLNPVLSILVDTMFPVRLKLS
jgi:hypothetical protein